MLRRAPAMTLLELLVVVAIIGILLGLLIPGLGTAWDVALDTQCKSNLHRIFQAFGVFAAGGDTGRVLGVSQFYPRVEYWPAVPYIVCEDARIFSCPQADAQPREPGEDDPFDPAVFGTGGSGGSGGTGGGTTPPPPPPPSGPDDYSRLDEVLGDLKYACRNRGFEISFADPGHQGLGRMNLGTRRGQNERGKYIEIGTKDCSPVDEAYFKPGSGNDGIIRVQEDADGRITATLVAYWCAEKNCVLYRGEPLFVSPSDPPDVRNPASIYYGWMGPGSSKQGMEVELSEPRPPTTRTGRGRRRGTPERLGRNGRDPGAGGPHDLRLRHGARRRHAPHRPEQARRHGLLPARGGPRAGGLRAATRPQRPPQRPTEHPVLRRVGPRRRTLGVGPDDARKRDALETVIRPTRLQYRPPGRV